MKEFSISIDVRSSPEKVWEVMKDVEHWKDWTKSVRSIRRFSKGELHVGSRLLSRQPKLPPSVWKIVELEDGRGFRSITGSPLMRVTANHSIEPTKDGTRVSLRISFSGLLARPAASWTADLNNRYLAMEANGLKTRCEGL